MLPFKKFFESKYSGTQPGVNHRHRGTGFTDTHSTYRRKHVNLVPDYVKTDASKNQKIENLKNNKGYGTKKHIKGIEEHGITKLHRKTFCKNIKYKHLYFSIVFLNKINNSY